MITEDYVSFEVAKLLKEKGFDSYEVGCLGGFYSERYYESGHGITTQSGQEVGIVYDDLTNSNLEYDEYLRPTHQMACKWLREVHNKHCDIGYDIDLEWYFQIIDLKETVEYDYPEPKYYHAENETGFKTYEEAVGAALKYVLENLI